MIASWLAGTDPITVATLAGVMLLEDIRRLPEQSVVLRRTLAGPWRASTLQPSPVTLLAWWSPLSTALAVPVIGTGMAQPKRRPEERWHSIRWHGRLLALLGGSISVGIVFGLPMLSARFGGAGFLGAVAAILLLCTATGVAGYLSLRRLGTDRRAATRRALAFCSPFAATGAYGALLETVAKGESPVRVARWLMRPADFADWIRPRAWDAINGTSDAELLGVLELEELQAIVHRAPAGRDGSAVAICERCGATWTMTGDCPECGVALIGIGQRAGAALPARRVIAR